MRNGDAKRVGSLEVNNQLKFGRLQHWKIGGFDAP
jgi:hypothetical protein